MMATSFNDPATQKAKPPVEKATDSVRVKTLYGSAGEDTQPSTQPLADYR
jgi:hypothetical protein